MRRRRTRRGRHQSVRETATGELQGTEDRPVSVRKRPRRHRQRENQGQRTTSACPRATAQSRRLSRLDQFTGAGAAIRNQRMADHKGRLVRAQPDDSLGHFTWIREALYWCKTFQERLVLWILVERL